MTGIEPAVSGSPNRRFTWLSYISKLVPRVGFEPIVLGLKGQGSFL